MPIPLINKDRRTIIIWLSLCALLVAAMVLVGGYTRLSGSGLSITSWKPIYGTIPPQNETQWNEEFSAYRATPQYFLVNKGMELAEFKTIFWPEFAHRLLGRAIGFVFFLPLLVFAARKSLSPRFFWRLVGIFALGGLQGAIGWIMVKSGLADLPYVNPLKLALHLSTAFAIFALILWSILDIISNKNPAKLPFHLPLSTYYFFLFLLSLQIIFGAIVAGSHAGLIYNSWPSMNGEFLPYGIFFAPLLQNLGFIQFLHRMVAILVAVGFFSWWFANRKFIKQNHMSLACAVIALIILVQFALGVATLILQVPLPLALAHQMNALLLWAAAICLLHRLHVTSQRHLYS